MKARSEMTERAVGKARGGMKIETVAPNESTGVRQMDQESRSAREDLQSAIESSPL